MIDPSYVPAVTNAERAYASYSDYCKRVGVACPTLEAYSRMTRHVPSAPTHGGTERPVRHPHKERLPEKRRVVRKQGGEYIVCD